MKSTVLINTLPVHPSTGGIKTFTLELLGALGSLNDKRFEYVILTTDKSEHLFSEIVNHDNVRTMVFHFDNSSAPKRILFEQVKLPGAINHLKNAMLFNICNVCVFGVSLPQLTVIQGALSIPSVRKSIPKQFINVSPLHKIYYDLTVLPSLKKSNTTVTVSEYTKSFLTDLNCPIEVIHEGVNLDTFNKKTSKSSKPYVPYLLAVNTLFPYKNTNQIIGAFAKYKAKHPDVNIRLKIAGKDPDGKQLVQLRQLTEKMNVSQDVEFLGAVPYEEIPELYQNASLFIYLSSVESFGLPVLEAMAADVPVISSNCMSLPEVVNDAGVLVHPEKTDEVSNAIERILNSVELQEELKAKGRENVLRFGWSIAAEKFNEQFADILDL